MPGASATTVVQQQPQQQQQQQVGSSNTVVHSLTSPLSRRRAMQEMTNEKRVTDQKVARVREVIKNVSNNDIVLALHNYDMDVERTIQALCEHGTSAVLDSWESTGAKSGKNKRNRNKNRNKNAAPIVNGTPNDNTTGHVQQNGLVLVNGTAMVNGVHTSPQQPAYQVTSAAPLPQRVPSSAGSKSSSIQQQPLLVPSTANGHTPPATNAQQQHKPAPHPTPTKAPPPQQQQQPHSGRQQQQRTTSTSSSTTSRQYGTPSTLSTDHLDTNDPQAKKKAISKEVKNLAKHDAVVERSKTRFNEEIDKADARVRRAFQELRQLLDSRESHVMAELAACKDEGHRVLAERAAHARELHTRSERVAVMSERELNDLRTDIKNFISERKYEEDLGTTVRFEYEPDPALMILKNFGHVVPVKPLLAHKHSSYSSLVSSVGEDSGLGMISPVSPGSDEKKPLAHVETGGIVMKSECFSTEQLQDLNRRLRESLASQGMSSDVFSNTSSAPVVARRRPPPNGYRGGGRGRGGGGRGGGGGRDGHASAGGGAHAQSSRYHPPVSKMPQLSIFQE